MKRSFSLLFVIIFCLLFCFNFQNTTFAEENAIEVAQSEDNAFRIVRSVSDNISLTYIFPANTSIFAELGYSEMQIKLFRFYLSIYIASLASQNRERAGVGVEVGQVEYFDDVDGIGFSIIFDDSDAQKSFFGEAESSPSSNVKSSGFFMKKIEIFVDFPISKTAADNMKLIFSYAVTSWAQNENISDTSQILSALDDAFFVYEFETSDQVLKSENMQSGDLTCHYFIRTYDDLEEQICFYATSANVPVWYLSALIFVIFGMLISYLILRKKGKKSKDTYFKIS